MKFFMDTQCFLCHIQKNLDIARKMGDEQTATAFLKELMRLYGAMPEDMSAPAAALEAEPLLYKYYGLKPDRFREEKERSNRFVMERYAQILGRVECAEDPIYSALQFAILGNYIDFSALHEGVSFEKLDEMLERAQSISVDTDCYEGFLRELEKGKKLLYLTDNAGEICFDRILAEQIHKRYPHLEITFCVRGGDTVNDATREDAQIAGIPFPVIDNGNCVCGTELKLLSPQARQALEEADVVISKGQSNTENLLGHGYPAYFAFLIKCGRFVDVFEKPMLTPMFLREPQKG